MRTGVLCAIMLSLLCLPGCHDRRMTTTPAASAVTESEAMEADQAFQRHYDSHFSKTGYAYSQYRPAYRYGYDLASDARNRDVEWTEMERAASRGWDSSKMGEWDRYKEAVRYGWDTKRNKR